MTKIVRKTKQINVHSHIEEAWSVIEHYLPRYNYVPRVQSRLKKSVSGSRIRNVKLYKIEDLDIINALLGVALEEKAKIEDLSNQLKNN